MVGDKLPTEKEIAQEYGVSRATVQNAMSRLTEEGWIERFGRRGTFVKTRPVDSARALNIDIHNIQSFEDEARLNGDDVTYRAVNFGTEPMDAVTAKIFGQKEGESAFVLERVRYVGNDCIGSERRFFAPETHLNLNSEMIKSAPTHELIQTALGQQIAKIDATLSAAVATEYQAKLLGVAVGAPLLVRKHTIYTKDNKPIVSGVSTYIEPFSFHYTARL